MEQMPWSGSDEVPADERRVFGDYVLLESLGRGSVGETFAARALKGPHQGDKVCLKLLHRQFLSPDQMGRLYRQAAVESLRHEARVVEQLTHPNGRPSAGPDRFPRAAPASRTDDPDSRPTHAEP